VAALAFFVAIPWIPPIRDSRGSSDSYVFMNVQADGVTPVTYSSCLPIHVEVNERTMPDGAEGILEEALAEVSALTGLEFLIDGTTERVPFKDPTRHEEYAPVLIAWTDQSAYTEIDDWAGLGGSGRIRVGVNGSTSIYVAGQVALNGPAIDQMLDRPRGREQARAIVIHELGHVLGLDHVEDPTQLMYDAPTVESAQVGDRTGFAMLGQGPCVEAW